MKKTILSILFLSAISMNVLASNTTIRSSNPVQCNGWGWVYGNIQTVWNNSCTPLEVKSRDGSVLSIPTTEGQCGDDQYGIYYYNQGSDHIEFAGCQ